MTATARPRALALALTAALGAYALADTALAQSAAPAFQVIELDYAPAQQTLGLDLRPGRYLLQLRREASGGFEGLLRGPRNEIVAERISFAVNGVCAGGVPSSAALSTYSLPGQPGLNMLGVEIGNAVGGCALRGVLPSMGLTTPEKPPQFLDCEEPSEVGEFGVAAGPTDPGPLCNIEKWNPPITAPRPDLEPGPVVRIGGTSAHWTRSLNVFARDAVARENGRCVFAYAYAVKNSGRARSAATDGSLLLEDRFGRQLDSQSLPGMVPGASQQVQGRLALPSGIWQVFAHVDSSASVSEWDGINNARSIVVNVIGDCSSGSAG